MTGYGIFPVHQVAPEGSTVTIQCDSPVNPKWFKDGEPFSSTDRKGNILIRSVKLKDRGNYTCLGVFRGNLFQVTSTLLVASKCITMFVNCD